MSQLSLTEVNQAGEEAFVEMLGGVYEESPWVARESASDRPFSSVEELHEAMRQTVAAATHDRQLALLRAHPDLGEQTEMTDASESEQSAAGLDSLEPEQYRAFQRLNHSYREKFGFPFIMAVKNESPDTIQTAMERRIGNAESNEFQMALDEVHTIARLRLDELLNETV
jgi:2-oxo-4-hydroxy-4-carboxy-5-ureidoimidazoline decarboxylase